jgi:hypothetical protein
MNELEKKLRDILEEVEAYNTKPSKACSGRIRKQLGELKKDVTPLRAALVALDKAGY